MDCDGIIPGAGCTAGQSTGFAPGEIPCDCVIEPTETGNVSLCKTCVSKDGPCDSGFAANQAGTFCCPDPCPLDTDLTSCQDPVNGVPDGFFRCFANIQNENIPRDCPSPCVTVASAECDGLPPGTNCTLEVPTGLDPGLTPCACVNEPTEGEDVTVCKVCQPKSGPCDPGFEATTDEQFCCPAPCPLGINTSTDCSTFEGETCPDGNICCFGGVDNVNTRLKCPELCLEPSGPCNEVIPGTACNTPVFGIPTISCACTTEQTLFGVQQICKECAPQNLTQFPLTGCDFGREFNETKGCCPIGCPEGIDINLCTPGDGEPPEGSFACFTILNEQVGNQKVFCPSACDTVVNGGFTDCDGIIPGTNCTPSVPTGFAPGEIPCDCVTEPSDGGGTVSLCKTCIDKVGDNCPSGLA